MAKRQPKYPVLAATMAARGETQGDLAHVLGVNESSVSMKLLGKRSLKKDEIDAICAHYGKTYEVLFDEKGAGLDDAADGEAGGRGA